MIGQEVIEKTIESNLDNSITADSLTQKLDLAYEHLSEFQKVSDIHKLANQFIDYFERTEQYFLSSDSNEREHNFYDQFISKYSDIVIDLYSALSITDYKALYCPSLYSNKLPENELNNKFNNLIKGHIHSSLAKIRDVYKARNNFILDDQILFQINETLDIVIDKLSIFNADASNEIVNIDSNEIEKSYKNMTQECTQYYLGNK